jgi:hypothetical protein
MRKIKVKLYAYENDHYVELYKVISGNTKNDYFARYTYGSGNDGVWYFVADPLCYCELDHACSGDYIFTVCDKNGKELFEDSNGEVKNPFPTLERKADLIWNEIKERYPCKKDGLTDWLLSYLTKEVAESKLKDLPCHASNWPRWYNEVSKEVIQRFDYLGDDFCIYKVTNKHKYCECEWINYYFGYETTEKYTGYCVWYGAWFDESHRGPNYSENEATKLVREMIESVYVERHNWKPLSYLKRTKHADYEQKVNYRQAAEVLLNGNYNRQFVHELIRKEKEQKTFYDNFEALRVDYPDAIKDTDYRYY